jgi:hypothetical protein
LRDAQSVAEANVVRRWSVEPALPDASSGSHPTHNAGLAQWQCNPPVRERSAVQIQPPGTIFIRGSRQTGEPLKLAIVRSTLTPGANFDAGVPANRWAFEVCRGGIDTHTRFQFRPFAYWYGFPTLNRTVLGSIPARAAKFMRLWWNGIHRRLKPSRESMQVRCLSAAPV